MLQEILKEGSDGRAGESQGMVWTTEKAGRVLQVSVGSGSTLKVESVGFADGSYERRERKRSKGRFVGIRASWGCHFLTW